MKYRCSPPRLFLKTSIPKNLKYFRLESRKRVTGITTPESFQRSRQAHGVMMLLIWIKSLFHRIGQLADSWNYLTDDILFRKSTLHFLFCMARTERTELCRGFWNLQVFQSSAAAHWLLLCVWTKTEHISWFRLRGFLYPNRLLSKNRRSTMRYRKSRTPYLSRFS